MSDCAHLLWGPKKQNTVFAVGKSILDRGFPVDVVAVCLGYGGGGLTPPRSPC